jgi:hypothetical protein
MNALQAKTLFSICHKAISGQLAGKEYECSLEEKKLPDAAGIFVTLYLDGDLRGCIGFTHKIALADGARQAALYAAFGDPRFAPLSKPEFAKISMEISVLTEPELIKVKSSDEYPGKVAVGKDGLIVKLHSAQGLLLPQVATEYGWNSRQLLEHTCEKAGLDAGSWKEPECKVYKFQAEVLKES